MSSSFPLISFRTTSSSVILPTCFVGRSREKKAKAKDDTNSSSSLPRSSSRFSPFNHDAFIVDSLFNRVTMVRIFGRCLPTICFSRKKRQSLPIGEQKTSGTRHHQEEVNKLFVRRVESIRVTQQGGIAKRLPLSTIDDLRPTSKKKTFVLLFSGRSIEAIFSFRI